MSIYQEHGYADRKDYLQSLAKEYNLKENIVFQVARILGENEDFDGLINAIEDYYAFNE